MLFSSDETLLDEQRRSSRLPRGETLSLMEERFERMEHERELREHRRWRQFAFLLFVVPMLAAILSVLAQMIVVYFTSPK